MKYFVLILILVITASAFADELRPELINSGDSLLRQELTADQFIATARKAQQERPFTNDEYSYIQDLRKKLSPDMDKFICGPDSGLQCDPQQLTLPAANAVPTQLAQNKLLQPTPTDSSRVPDIPEESETFMSRPAILIGATVVLAVIVASAFRNKEVQFNYR